MSDASQAPPLEPKERARGRRLAISSHPASMTHRNVFTDQLPTLALVSLGANEFVVGLQRSFEPLGNLLQLPTLRAVGRVRKRTILVAGHVLALLGGIPLLFFGTLRELGAAAIPIVLTSLAITSVGVVVSGTVWFPLLRSYVEADRIGRFFGTLRSGWHLALIFYFLGAQWWLGSHPGSFGPLFTVAFVLGILRLFLIARLPERSEQTGQSLRIRDALSLLRSSPSLRLYILGVGITGGLRRAMLPFVIVMLRRVIGFSDAEVVMTTVASFAGGLASLYLWGRAVDRVGPVPVFIGTTVGTALLYSLLIGVQEPGTGTVLAMVLFFFLLSVVSSGFGVADTHVLFQLAPGEAPAGLLVVAAVVTSFVYGVAPLAAGAGLSLALSGESDPLGTYHLFFLGIAVAQLVGILPLLRFRRFAASSESLH